jgi:alkylation response protein AidB-like acyl-CoA dehydrogenase
MATGEALGCFCLTEPDHGSDPATLESTAVKEGDTYRINGSKIFITNGDIAGVALVMARTGGPGARGVSAFLVPCETAGFTPKPIHGKLGLRSCDTAEISLNDVVVPASALLGEEGDGIKVALSALDDGRMSLAASCTGLAQNALEVARLLTWRVADLKMRGEKYTLAASMAKYYASEASVRAANAAVQVHGGYGYVDEFVVGKLLRDARVTTLYEGTSQIQKLLIGRAVTGVSAFG